MPLTPTFGTKQGPHSPIPSPACGRGGVSARQDGEVLVPPMAGGGGGGGGGGNGAPGLAAGPPSGLPAGFGPNGGAGGPAWWVTSRPPNQCAASCRSWTTPT